MKLTLLQLVNAQEVLVRLGSEKMDIQTAYYLQRNIRMINPELGEVIKARNELIKNKYGKLSEKDPNIFEVPQDHMSAYMKEWDTLTSVEVDLEIHPFLLSEFHYQISALDLMTLDWMFIDDKE